MSASEIAEAGEMISAETITTVQITSPDEMHAGNDITREVGHTMIIPATPEDIENTAAASSNQDVEMAEEQPNEEVQGILNELDLRAEVVEVVLQTAQPVQ